MGNSFAVFMLLVWPLVTLVLFRRMPLAQALCWSVIAGYLLLPGRTGWNFPMVPVIDKTLIAGVSATIMCLVMAGQERAAAALPDLRTRIPTVPVRSARGAPAAAARPAPAPAPPAESPAEIRIHRFGRGLLVALLLLMLLMPFLTVLANEEPALSGGRMLQPLRFYDALSMTGDNLVRLLPFILAAVFLGTPDRHVLLLRILAVAGALYAVLVLYEWRMSPQLNIRFYGFFPHSWLQHIRDGGFRPVVFLHHGLWVGIFLAMAALAACAMWRQQLADRLAPMRWLWIALWIGAVLLLSRNLGATFMMLMVAPIIIFAGLRSQVIVAGVMAGIVLTYPMLRGAGWVPTEFVVTQAARFSEDRAQSLETRLTNEDMLLARANLKPLTGWGGYGRNRVFNDQGGDITITDGAWIIALGVTGWLGYIAQFGLLTLPTLLMALRRRAEMTYATAGLMLVGAVACFDLLPNATLTPVTWLVCGAIAGRHARSVARAPEPGPVRPAFGPPALGPTAFGPTAAGPGRGVLAGPRQPDALAAAPRHQRRPRG